MVICMLAGVLCITAFAIDEPAEGTVLRVSALKSDGSTEAIDDYDNFEDGWNAAMEFAANFKELSKKGYKRVVVDLCSDWEAVEGEFSDDLINGKGFNWDTIYFPAGVHVTLNLNGYTIDRGLEEYQYNGEVMYVDKNANVIINDGTITGGWSCNGAGGIHINDDANVTLNNVNLVGNVAEDDDGAAVAVYDGAKLIMNGGSISQNTVYNTTWLFLSLMGKARGTIYVEDSEAIFKNVTIKENVAKNGSSHGLVVYANNSSVVMEDCVVEENGYVDDEKNYVSPLSFVYSEKNIDITFTNTKFLNNGDAKRNIKYGDTGGEEYSQTALMSYYSILSSNVHSAALTGCTVTGNNVDYLFDLANVKFEMNDCTITDNRAYAVYDRLYFAADCYAFPRNFQSCTFNNNIPEESVKRFCGKTELATFAFYAEHAEIYFNNCEFGDSTFLNKDYAHFSEDSSLATASVFGEGSLTMIVSLLALIASGVAIFLVVYYNKKKAVPATETEDEE